MSKSDRSTEKQFTCPMCGKPIDLNRDETADEEGQMPCEGFVKQNWPDWSGWPTWKSRFWDLSSRLCNGVAAVSG